MRQEEDQSQDHPRLRMVTEAAEKMGALRQAMKVLPGPTKAEEMGFLTDTSLCIGCKACEVACKQWNQLPADGYEFSGQSYDNTLALGATTWRHVSFYEDIGADRKSPHWLFNSDVCKHCRNAPCQLVCPTGALIRTEFDSVVVQDDICNGCGYCVVACPFGVIERSHGDGGAHKCTLCYDRLQDGMPPACAKACPTESIQFGPVAELRQRGRRRARELTERGEARANFYGDSEILGAGLNSMFVLLDRPERYNLPKAPKLPQSGMRKAYGVGVAVASALAIWAALALSEKS